MKQRNVIASKLSNKNQNSPATKAKFNAAYSIFFPLFSNDANTNSNWNRLGICHVIIGRTRWKKNERCEIERSGKKVNNIGIDAHIDRVGGSSARTLSETRTGCQCCVFVLFFCFIGVTDSMRENVCLGKFHLFEPTYFAAIKKTMHAYVVYFARRLTLQPRP